MFAIIRVAACVGALGTISASVCLAQSEKPSNDIPTFSSRKDNADGSSAMTFGARLPATVETKLGVDLGVPPPPDVALDPDKLLQGNAGDRGSEAGWVSMMMPAAPFGFAKASADARFDPNQDKSKFGMAVSRPLNDSMLLTLKNSYAVTGSPSAGALPGLPPATSPSAPTYEVGRALRFDVLPTSTALSAGLTQSTGDERWLRTMSAEQKVYGPLSVTGAVSETTSGPLDRSIKAGFKKTW